MKYLFDVFFCIIYESKKTGMEIDLNLSTPMTEIEKYPSYLNFIQYLTSYLGMKQNNARRFSYYKLNIK